MSRSSLDVQLQGLPITVPASPRPSAPQDPGFRDRIQPRIGVEYVTLKRSGFELPVRAGYVYEKSPVPPQTGASNSLDTDRHVLSAGVGLRLLAPIAELPGEVRLDVHAAYASLPERRTYKSNAADFTGDYAASGAMTALGFVLAVGF
jgi:long-chain fatty acid transport protein